MRLVGLRLRTALASSIYKKSLRLSNASRKAQTGWITNHFLCFTKKGFNVLFIYFSAGEIVNLISVDSQKIEDAAIMLNMLWSCPLQVGLAIYFLYDTIGVSVFVGKLSKKITSMKY